MKLKLTLAVAAIAALAIPFVASAGSSTDRATGGGQILFSSKGAGNTIAFQAQGSETAATGMVQYINREAGKGRSQVKRHGAVTCLRVEGNTAKLAGTWEKGATGDFQLLVVDNGQGSLAENDLVTVQNNQDPTCSEEDDDDDASTELGRGNAKVYDAP